jgi:hypothetical protein
LGKEKSEVKLLVTEKQKGGDTEYNSDT